MPANNKQTLFMSGKIHWAKVTGEPRPNYGGDAREWTFEFEPDEAGIAQLKAHKLTDRLKDKEKPDRKVLVLRKSEFNKDGNPNPPIRLYDGNDEEWDTEKLIGNNSSGDVKLDVRDYGPGKKKGIYPVALRVTDLVVYQSAEFGGFPNKNANNLEKAEADDDAIMNQPVAKRGRPKLEAPIGDLDDELLF